MSCIRERTIHTVLLNLIFEITYRDLKGDWSVKDQPPFFLYISQRWVEIRSK